MTAVNQAITSTTSKSSNTKQQGQSSKTGSLTNSKLNQSNKPKSNTDAPDTSAQDSSNDSGDDSVNDGEIATTDQAADSPINTTDESDANRAARLATNSPTNPNNLLSSLGNPFLGSGALGGAPALGGQQFNAGGFRAPNDGIGEARRDAFGGSDIPPIAAGGSGPGGYGSSAGGASSNIGGAQRNQGKQQGSPSNQTQNPSNKRQTNNQNPTDSDKPEDKEKNQSTGILRDNIDTLKEMGQTELADKLEKLADSYDKFENYRQGIIAESGDKPPTEAIFNSEEFKDYSKNYEESQAALQESGLKDSEGKDLDLGDLSQEKLSLNKETKELEINEREDNLASNIEIEVLDDIEEANLDEDSFDLD